MAFLMMVINNKRTDAKTDVRIERDFDLISPALREEIRLKIDKIGNNPQAYGRRRDLVKQSLRHIGDIYSFWIENPDLRAALIGANLQEGTVKKRARKGIRAVHDAWYFISQKGKPGNFINIFDYDIFRGINGLVNGGSKEEGRFRKSDVTLNIPGFTPTSPERIPSTVAQIIVDTRKKYAENPLEGAIYAHLAFALTQPFSEGNKRTARLVQDKLLDDAGLPPAIISAGEGKFYLDLIKRTASAYRDEDLAEQRQFYDYMASKVNNGLDDILDDLDIS